MKDATIVPRGFSTAVRDIKLAILQARARAARVSNVEALKLYFFVGGYVSRKTRTAKWGTGAINALSERLQVELPGLRGFSPSSIKFMRLLYEGWMSDIPIRYLTINELPNESKTAKCSLSTTGKSTMSTIRQSAINELSKEDLSAFFAVGFTHHMKILFKTKDIAERWLP